MVQQEDIVKDYLNMDLLRFTTAGSVDDGKSTLIGRLLYDSKAIFQDQLDAIEESTRRKGEEGVNLALLTDGLRAEREQGITIDVAYRYFHTPKRKFIIADTPGHIQYTRNMVTGASTADLAIILIDARNGVSEQTIRHAYIASLLQIRYMTVCVNKMDLVNYSEEIFNKIQSDFNKIAQKLHAKEILFVPICAKFGDNVVEKSTNMPWYKGPALITLLETIPVEKENLCAAARFPVQFVIRPMTDEFHDYRGYAGRVAGGTFHKGQDITVLPSGLQTKIESIDVFNKNVNEAYSTQSVTISLESDIDISRGNMIVPTTDIPCNSKDIEMMICWFNEKPLILRGKYIVKHTTNDVQCIISEIKSKININNLEHNFEDKNIRLNDIAHISIKTSKPLFYDPYEFNRITGSLILIDEGTNETVGAGMIIR